MAKEKNKWMDISHDDKHYMLNENSDFRVLENLDEEDTYSRRKEMNGPVESYFIRKNANKRSLKPQKFTKTVMHYQIILT